MTKLDELLERKRKVGNIGAIDFLIDREQRRSARNEDRHLSVQKRPPTQAGSSIHTIVEDCTPNAARTQELSSFRTADGRWIPALLDLQYQSEPLVAKFPISHPELVSIIIPSYNNQKWLRRAINSARSQIDVNCEIIVVDDGSTDSSVTIASEIAQIDKRVQTVSLLRNFGCYYARNIGILHSKGEFITIVDSDDIIAPNRITAQLTALKDRQGAVASRSRQRRWSADYLTPLGDRKLGENSLLWRRNIIEAIGYYDSVRFSGDGEFRLRMESVFGRRATVNLNDELYFTRSLASSLTRVAESRIFSVNNDRLQVEESEPRIRYREAFSKWHATLPNETRTREQQIPIPFPLQTRFFPLGADTQCASPSQGQRIVGAMATYPPRLESLETTISSILPQLDELRIYLNNFDDTPSFVKHPKIKIYRSQDHAGDLRDNGKFYDLPHDEASYIFLFDDDILYPVDYVAKLVHHIEMFGRTSVVGVHGITFPEENFTNLSERTVHTFYKKSSGHFVDMLGTGTVAWHSSSLKLSLSDFETKGLSDVWFTRVASRQGVPQYAVSRADNWLTLIKRFDQSLWVEAKTNSTAYFDIYRSKLEPILAKGRLRRRMEQHLSSAYGEAELRAAGIELHIEHKVGTTAPQGNANSASLAPNAQLFLGDASHDSAAYQTISFHIIVNGWNCAGYVDKCLRSVAEQTPGPYTYHVTLVDDGSTDSTFDKLAHRSILPDANVIRVPRNIGPAHARHTAIKAVCDPNAVIVLLDMDDELFSNALYTVSEQYLSNPRCNVTMGNWCDQNGKKNKQSFYTDEEIDEQRVRQVELFNAAPLRTFRRHLYNAITIDDLTDKNGHWLQTCTDVAIMYPILDQCWSSQVQWIDDPIYLYNRRHATGTLKRFGKPYKIDRLNYLKSRRPKQRRECKP